LSIVQFKDFTTDPDNFPTEAMASFVNDLHASGQRYGNILSFYVFCAQLAKEPWCSVPSHTTIKKLVVGNSFYAFSSTIAIDDFIQHANITKEY